MSYDEYLNLWIFSKGFSLPSFQDEKYRILGNFILPTCLQFHMQYVQARNHSNEEILTGAESTYLTKRLRRTHHFPWRTVAEHCAGETDWNRSQINHPTAMAFIPVTFVAILLSIVAASADQGLHLKSYSEEQVEGCYIHNQTLGVCFDIGKDSMKLLKITGEQIVLYKELGPKMFLYQALDQAFIG